MPQKNFNFKKDELVNFARELRKTQTDAEKLLWEVLKDRKVDGHKFRRQHPFGKYVLDFYCAMEKLCVELDGGGHARQTKTEHDEERSKALEKEGLRVLRFWNNDVLDNIEGVIDAIIEGLGRKA